MKRSSKNDSQQTSADSPGSKIHKSLINELSFGWLGSMADLSLVLLSTACKLHQAAFTPRRSTSEILNNAGALFEALRSERLQKSLRHGLDQIAEKGYRDQWEITDKGYERLKHLVPKYLDKRQWDGSCYIVMFDIPENLRRSREELRNILTRTGCGMLQKSVWMSFVDPELVIADIREWHELEEYVMILKTDGNDERTRKQLQMMTADAFKLSSLNLRYRAFLDQVQAGDQSPMQFALVYLGILKNDPQLPFELLPEDWVGDVAFRTYKEQIIPTLPHQQSAFINALLAL